MSFPARELHFTWQVDYCCRYSDFFTYQYRSALQTKDKTLPQDWRERIDYYGIELIDRKIPISAINARLWYRRRHRPFWRIPRNTIRVSISNRNSDFTYSNSCPAPRVLDWFSLFRSVTYYQYWLPLVRFPHIDWNEIRFFVHDKSFSSKWTCWGSSW